MKETALTEPAMRESATLVLAVKLCYPRMLTETMRKSQVK
jgi:hypothetical protein